MGYYIWSIKNGGYTDGIVTRKRIPLNMDVSDIIGEYIIDNGRGGDDGYGLENIDKAFPWVQIVNTPSDGDDILRLSFYYKTDDAYDGEDGIDTYTFVEELKDVPFDDPDVYNENYCITLRDFLNIWYERSGEDSRFHPSINAIWDVMPMGVYTWEGIESQERVLWNDEYNNVSMDNFYSVYPIEQYSLDGNDMLTLYKIDDLGKNQLIRVKDIPDFEIYNVKMDGYMVSPDVYGTSSTTMGFIDNSWGISPSFSFNMDTIPNSDNRIITSDSYIYNDKEICHDVPSSIQLQFNVITNGNHILTDSTYDPYINVTMRDGQSCEFSVINKTYNTYTGSYTVNLNSNWRKSSITNPSSSLYDGVYESYSNYNVDSGVATMKITISRYKKFSIYIRSDAETTWDYIMVSQLDKTITGSTSYSDTTLVKAHTSGNQQSGTVIENYTLVEYNDIPNGTHTITIVYRKDGSLNRGSDRGYVLISKNNESYEETENIITAMYNNDFTCYPLSSLIPIQEIDYSSLVFIGSGTTPTPTSYHKLYYTNYWLCGGTSLYGSGRINLSTEANNFSINASVGDFISLNGASTLLGNVSFTVGGSGSSRYIQFDSSKLDNVKGQTCYFRVKCLSYISISAIFYLCFKVTVNATDFTYYTSSIGDCTLWLDSENGGIVLNRDRTNTGNLTLYPMFGNYSNGRVINNDEIYNTFAHGHFDTDARNNITLNYNCDSLATIDVECAIGEVVSLISPRCTDIDTLVEYLTSSPSIEITVYL